MIRFEVFDDIVDNIVAVDQWIQDVEYATDISLNNTPVSVACRVNSRFILAKLFGIPDVMLEEFLEELIDVLEGDVDRREFYDKWA